MNPKTILRTLKGAPLACLLACFMPDMPTPASEMWFARRTGYTRKTCRQALQLLADLDVVAQINGQWLLGNGYQQLPIPWPQIGEGKIYPHNPTTTTTIGREDKKTISTAEAVAADTLSEGKIYPHNQKPPDLSTAYPQKSTTYPQAEIIDARVADFLKAQGIGPPTCDQLATKPHITIQYAQAHIAAGRDAGDKLNLIIWRMQCSDPAPADYLPCDACGKQKANCLCRYKP